MGQFYRFAAMEVDPSSKAIALSLVLSGGVIAAFAGPETALWTKTMLEHKYVEYRHSKPPTTIDTAANTTADTLRYEGTYMFLVIYSALPCAMLYMVRFPAAKTEAELKTIADKAGEERTLSEM